MLRFKVTITLVARAIKVPLYEYECRKCHVVSERIENLNGPHLKSCPKCKGVVDRIISRSAIQFKGSGWYVTDYAKSSSAGSAGDSGKSETASAPAATADKNAAAADAKSKAKSAPANKGKKASGDK
jgi:putative FmdB family regulatory protein